MVGGFIPYWVDNKSNSKAKNGRAPCSLLCDSNPLHSKKHISIAEGYGQIYMKKIKTKNKEKQKERKDKEKTHY
jgi:hypothetical protein